MATRKQYEKLVERIQNRYPDSKIKYKDEHWFWKRLPKMLSRSGITFPKTIWMPNRGTNLFGMLAHEYQHLVDYHKIGTIGFDIIYLSPQLLAILWIFLMILAIGFSLKTFAIIFAIAGIISLLPWPSKGRTSLEMSGYSMTLFVAALSGQNIFEYRKFIVDALKSWLYYKMVWTDKKALELTLNAIDEISDKEAITNKSVAFRDVYEIITE